MKCPCCLEEMLFATGHDSGTSNIQSRIHNWYICQTDHEICNGLMVRESLEDDKLTYITAAHTCSTLHVNYVKQASKEDLLKHILSTFEWEIYTKITNPPITQFQMWIMEDSGKPKFLGYSSGKDFIDALTNAHITNEIIGDMDYVFLPEKVMVRDLDMRYYDLYPSRTDLLACHPVMEDNT